MHDPAPRAERTDAELLRLLTTSAAAAEEEEEEEEEEVGKKKKKSSGVRANTRACKAVDDEQPDASHQQQHANVACVRGTGGVWLPSSPPPASLELVDWSTALIHTLRFEPHAPGAPNAKWAAKHSWLCLSVPGGGEVGKGKKRKSCT